MTVKELIEHLNQFDPETEVFTSITDPTDYMLTLPLESEDMVLEDELFGDNISDTDTYDDQFDDEGNYLGKPILVIKLEY